MICCCVDADVERCTKSVQRILEIKTMHIFLHIKGIYIGLQLKVLFLEGLFLSLNLSTKIHMNWTWWKLELTVPNVWHNFGPCFLELQWKRFFKQATGPLGIPSPYSTWKMYIVERKNVPDLLFWRQWSGQRDKNPVRLRRFLIYSNPSSYGYKFLFVAKHSMQVSIDTVYGNKLESFKVKPLFTRYLYLPTYFLPTSPFLDFYGCILFSLT